MFIGAAPVAGVYAGKVICPPAGEVSAPVFEYCNVCAVPTAVPSTRNCVVHSFTFAVFTK
jgi:hypothetical protein